MIKDLMLSYGYSEEDIDGIIASYSLAKLSPETLEKKIKENYEFLLRLGYSKEDVIKMTKSLPTIYGYSIDNMRQKIEFYDSIDMHDLAIVDPQRLMQSVDLSYARYEFLKSKGIMVDMSNYGKLFTSNKKFEKTYGVTKQEILEKYSYEKHMEEIKNGDIR